MPSIPLLLTASALAGLLVWLIRLNVWYWRLSRSDREALHREDDYWW